MCSRDDFFGRLTKKCCGIVYLRGPPPYVDKLFLTQRGARRADDEARKNHMGFRLHYDSRPRPRLALLGIRARGLRVV